MAHINPLDMLISAALDERLTDEEERMLTLHLAANEKNRDFSDRMLLVDAALRNPPQAAPPHNFVVNVMARVETAETSRRWTPWLILALAVSSVLAALCIAAPIALFGFGLKDQILQWPAVSQLITWLGTILTAVQSGAAYILGFFSEWFDYLFSEPAALALVLTALVIASTWIGLREALRANISAQTSQQA